MGDHFFLLLFPKDSESLKFLDIQLWEVGGQIHLNGTLKVNTQTNTQIDRQTYAVKAPNKKIDLSRVTGGGGAKMERGNTFIPFLLTLPLGTFYSDTQKLGNLRHVMSTLLSWPSKDCLFFLDKRKFM